MGISDFLKKGEQKPIAEPEKPKAQATPPPAQQQPTQKEEIYTVQKGDSLSKISKEYFGDSNQWHKIFDANKNQISDPNKIQVGQKLIIPK
jgi:nucleoid-associated protein YgaU